MMPDSNVNVERTVEITCAQVRAELVDYLEDDVSPALRARINEHVNGCPGCRTVYDGVRNVLSLVAGGSVIELPPGFSQRLRERLAQAVR